MQAIYGFVLKYVLDFAFSKIQNYLKKNNKKQKSKTETKRQVARLKRAISEAYDGEKISEKQSKEIITSAKELMRNY